MKTADLIQALAVNSAAPQARTAPAIAVSAAVGAAVTFVVLVLWMGLQPIGPMVAAGWFWMKMAYTWALALAGLAIVARMASPGRGPGLAAPLGVIACVAVMATLAAMEILHAAPAAVPSLFVGMHAQACSLRILALSAPVYAVVVVVLRRFAPTRLTAAGAAAGLLAGAVAASVYNLGCMETTATFVLIWFTLGIAVCAGLGALIGPRLLRW